MEKPVLKFTTGKFGRYLPACDISRAIIKIAKRQTLRRSELVILSDEGGFDVEVD